MASLKKIFRSLVIASKGIEIKPEKSKIEPSPKPEEHIEKSKLEKEIEGYIMLPLPETLTLKEMKKLRIKGIKKERKGIKKEKKEKKEKKVKPKIKGKKITKKKIKKKARKPKKPKIDKKVLKKQLLTIEKKYKALKKKGYSDEELKTIKDKINKIKHLFP